MYRIVILSCLLVASCTVTRTMINTMNATSPNLKSKEMIQYLDAQIIPLPDDVSGITRFPFLDSVLRSSQVIGLGESTHGTGEFYALKDNLIRYSINHHGYKLAVIEFPASAAVYLNRYIRNEPNSVFQPYLSRFWIYNTEEVKRMLDWMRNYNRSASAGNMIQLYGIDPQNNEYALPLLKEVSETLPALKREWDAPLEMLSSFFAIPQEKYNDLPQANKVAYQKAISDLQKLFADNREKYISATSGAVANEIEYVLATVVQT